MENFVCKALTASLLVVASGGFGPTYRTLRRPAWWREQTWL